MTHENQHVLETLEALCEEYETLCKNKSVIEEARANMETEGKSESAQKMLGVGVTKAEE